MDKKKIDSNFWDDFDNKVTCALVPRFTENEVRPCAEDDYRDYAKNLENNLYRVVQVLDDLLQHEIIVELSTKVKKYLIKVFVIIGEQHLKSAWNNVACVERSVELIPRICKIFQHDSVAKTLEDDEIFMSIVKFLRPKLLKDTWKSYPSAVLCYKWLLKSMAKPLLKRHVPEILPTALIIFDDYVPENQICGLDCIDVIIEHCQQSKSLRNLNYDEVIYQALEKMTHKVTPDMIIPVYSCMSKLLKIIDFCDDNSNKFGWTKKDDVLVVLLDNMELQSKIEIRYAYAVSLKNFLTPSSSGKQIKRLSRVLSEYCENVIELKTTDVMLDLLKLLLSSTYQPFNIDFYAAMYGSLLKLCLELSSRDDVEIIRNKARECISLMNELCPKLSNEIMDNDIVQSVIKDS